MASNETQGFFNFLFPLEVNLETVCSETYIIYIQIVKKNKLNKNI